MTSHCRKRLGFTLLEMAVVLVVMGVLLGLALTRGAPRGLAVRPRDAAQQIADALRDARGRAIASGRLVEFRLDLAHHAFRVADDAPHALPPQMALNLTTISRAADALHDAGAIRFSPDGSASGGRIVIADAAHHRAEVAVAWLDGLVTVRDVP